MHGVGRREGGAQLSLVRARADRRSEAAAAQQAVAELKLGGSFTVVHVGGLQSTDDVARSRATGAELRQWYTGLMHGLASPSPETLYARLTVRKA